VHYRSARATLEPSRDGEYMVMRLRGHSECNKGYNVKGVASIAKCMKGAVRISAQH
jgi:hypothetical protein